MDSVRRLLVPAVVLVGMWSPPAPGQLSGRPPFGNISGRSGRAYVGGSPGAVSPYLISNEQALKILQANQGPIRAVAFSPNGKFLATAGNDNLIHVWGLASGSELRQLAGHQQAVTSVAFAPDGKTLASGSLDRTVRLWDLATGEEVRRFEGHQRE
ncbi:MAG: hypothetical protein JO112_19415, partial [Planctomycetes bacterium]|nr:hypothetical protein [Planctomycetota bacterium]